MAQKRLMTRVWQVRKYQFWILISIHS